MWYTILTVTLLGQVIVRSEKLSDEESNILNQMIEKLKVINTKNFEADFIATVKNVTKELSEEAFVKYIQGHKNEEVLMFGNVILLISLEFSMEKAGLIRDTGFTVPMTLAKKIVKGIHADWNKLNKSIVKYMKKLLGTVSEVEEKVIEKLSLLLAV